MRIRILILAGLLAWANCVLSGSSLASDEQPRTPDPDEVLAQMMAPEAWLREQVTEADIDLFFAYLRASLFGSAYGYDVPVPEGLKSRAEALGRELRRHGVATALLLLQAMEARARKVLPRLRQGHPPSTYRL